MINHLEIKSKKSDWIPELTGMRGLAILCVLVGHAFFLNPQVPGYSFLMQIGSLGVDLFFVLSGYLITRLLFKAKNESNHFFRNFYIRRILRIAPLYLVVISAFFFLPQTSYLEVMAATRRAMTDEKFFFYTLTINWREAFHKIPILYVGHVWSLCIEEQFYIFWPLVIRWLDSKRIIQITLLMILASLLYRWSTIDSMPEDHSIYKIYTSTLCRMDSLLFGCLAYFISAQPFRFQRVIHFLQNKFFNFFMILIFLGHHFTSHEDNPFYFLSYTIISVFFTLLLLRILHVKSKIYSTLFQCRFLTRLGVISYGLYLFHLPIFSWIQLDLQLPLKLAFLGNDLSIILPSLMGIAISFFLSLISWNYFEKPILGLKSRFQ